jgi:outer membrane receptor protein involved in Fe transport
MEEKNKNSRSVPRKMGPGGKYVWWSEYFYSEYFKDFPHNKQWDLELAANNLFNSKQYVSASYSDISTYYYSYNLRPASLLLKARFKLK